MVFKNSDKKSSTEARQPGQAIMSRPDAKMIGIESSETHEL